MRSSVDEATPSSVALEGPRPLWGNGAAPAHDSTPVPRTSRSRGARPDSADGPAGHADDG